MSFGELLIGMVVLAGSVVLSLGARCAETNSPTADEIEVYSAILKNTQNSESRWLMQPENPAGIARTQNQVITYAKIIDDEKLSGDEKAAAEDWVGKIYQPHLFTNQLSLPIKWQLVTEQDLKSLSNANAGGWWKSFHKKFPGTKGIITASRVGLSKDRQTAFLHWTTSFGELGAESSYLILKKREGRWRIEKRLRTIMA
jgi:hypothetical protein